jgi:hypothetical protein
MRQDNNADELTRLRAEVEDHLDELSPADDEALTVCVTHLRFVPCRKDGEHRTSQHPDAVAAVRAYQDAPADDEGTGTGAAPSEGHSEAQGDAHCQGHGGPGRWYCCQHPDAGWPCTEEPA